MTTYRIETMIRGNCWELEPNGAGFASIDEAESAVESLLALGAGYERNRVRVVEEKDRESTMTVQAKVVMIALCESEESGTYEVTGLLHPDGRLYVQGAGVDGGDSLFASVDDYEPNGLDKVESIVVTEETRGLDLTDLASGDIDNVRYDTSLLTAEEASAVRHSIATACERWVAYSEER